MGECPKIAGKIYALSGERVGEQSMAICRVDPGTSRGRRSRGRRREAVGVAAVVAVAKVATKLKLWTGKNF